ncbi:hypothetical protein [Sulfitobacter guttiformis]|uniref:Uncharacterized protein n=1 Tax=Sulfitobacter guttiformis TaxID=74349 RepID=A0A420DNB5_9RHOB|nr:hypothetical protein [Sulfitobacter guttiformis]KIN73045.1 hypothetical protein Z949_2227 [Sulfitobacter guttiformis KCTC 32187]RKE95731.1 hypothetical protein C8N30_0268 [Sulfitobacter guttiformis]
MTHLASLVRKLSGLRLRSQTVAAPALSEKTTVGNADAAPAIANTALAKNASQAQTAADKAHAPSPFRKKRDTSTLKEAKGLRRSAKVTKIHRVADTGTTTQNEPQHHIVVNGHNAQRTAHIGGACKNLHNLSIPCPDPTREERIRDAHQNRALKLVRQEDWDKLIAMITTADRDRSLTDGGMSVAELMAFGARADVVLAVEHALVDRTPEHDAPMLRGIEALEYVLAEYPDNYVIGCIVAQAHIDIAWAWRGVGWDVEIAPRNREAFDAHFARARDIVVSFKNMPENSALLASTACALLRGDNYSTESVADRYQALIDLNPKNISSLRALGTHMLPRWYGSYAALELEARRTAARTTSEWGAGGYAWVMFDAITVDDKACAQLDLPFFIEGLRDIVRHRPEPHTINLLAAYCANTMGQAYSGNDAADHTRAQIAACADWIVREHLTELHPMIWAHAAQGFANNLRVSSPSRFAAAGQDDALRIIAGLFKREIAEGKRIVFTDQGPVATAA